MPAAGSQGPARWAWEAEAGQSVVLYTKTTPSIDTVSLFPCLAVLIIKKGHIEKEGMRKMNERLFLSPPRPTPLNKHCTLRGIIRNNVSFWAHRGFVMMWLCFESVRTVCDVHQQCQPQLVGWRMWIDGKPLWHRQVQHEHCWKEFIFVLSGNCTVVRLLKSTMTLGKRTTRLLPCTTVAVAKSEVYITCWLGLLWLVIGAGVKQCLFIFQADKTIAVH